MRVLVQVFAVLFVVGLIVKYIWWIIATAALILLVRMAYRGFLLARTELAAEAAATDSRRRHLIAQADQQHAWEMAGDPRGTFGEYRAGID